MNWLVSSNIHLQKMCLLRSGWLEHRHALATVFAVSAQFFRLPLEGVCISGPALPSKSNTHSRVMDTCELPGISAILLGLWLKYLREKKNQNRLGGFFFFLFSQRSPVQMSTKLSVEVEKLLYGIFLFFWWSKVKADMTSGGVDKYTQQRAPATDYLNQLCWLYWSTGPLCWYVGVRNASSLT